MMCVWCGAPGLPAPTTHRIGKVVKKMTKKYMIDTYALYLSDFCLARNEDDEWKARHGMARLEALACQLYGFEFCDELPVLAREKLA